MTARFVLRFVTILTVFMIGATLLPTGSAFAQASVTKPYLMSFDTCTSCTGPSSSLTQLAQSDDGVTWQLIPGYTPVFGGVPAVVRRGNTIYIVSQAPYGNGGSAFAAMQVQRFHMDTGVWESPVTISLSDPNALAARSDPAAILNAQGQIVLIYDTNPTGCPSSICRLREATEVSGSDGSQFIAQANDIYTSGISTFVDATIFSDGSQYVVYALAHNLSPSTPPAGLPIGIGVFTSPTLAGPFSLSTAFPNGTLFQATPQVTPGWGAGFYNSARGEYWNYLTYQTVPAPPVLPGPIYRSVQTVFGRQVSTSDLTPVATDASLGLTPDQITFHLHFAKNWSGNQTTTATVIPHSATVTVGGTVTATVTLTNTDIVTAADCFVAPLTVVPATFNYQATNPVSSTPITTPNTPVAVSGNGGVQTFTIALTPSAPISATDVRFTIGCASTTNATPISGVNTLLLSTSGGTPPVAQGTITPASNFFPYAGSGGGSLGAASYGQVAVSAPSGTAWTAVSNASWLTIVTGASGSGNGSVHFSVAANPGSALRAGTLTIAGLTFTVTEASPPPPPTVIPVVEYYNSSSDDYFITNVAAEQTMVDSGAAGPWVRTGKNFNSGGSAPVYRFGGNSNIDPATAWVYGPLSHFYTLWSDEQSWLQTLYNPNAAAWVLEGPTPTYGFSVPMYMTQPNLDSSCPAGTVPVYRANNNGRHRYTPIASALQEVLFRHWVNEGLAFCAPQ
jgi:Putative binding domain, N-terminal